MHMADALLSPAVGGTMAAVSAGAIGLSVKKISGDRLDEKKIPMMGVMGAFVFAAQMINFTIPGTGSSGHIGGGILLAAILGPFPALLTITAVLIIQCLLFADGGLLALGCNIFNMGVCACLIGWPLIYRPLLRRGLTKKRITAASVLAVTASLQLGAFCVVLETLASGVTALPFKTFLLLMQPIHLAIGLVEGLVTAAVLCFLHAARPELLTAALEEKQISGGVPLKKVLITFLALAALLAGVVSLYASRNPDGLEWSIRGVTGSTELKSGDAVHKAAGKAVKKTALMPDYATDSKGGGTAAAGLIGSAVTLAAAAGIGGAIHAVRKRKKQ
jgi:cobalt/nickel transport system permease protein